MPESITAQAPYVFSLPGNSSETGSLHFWENLELFPDGIQRCFWISGVKEGETRGNHAHWQESQVIVAVAGSVQLEIQSAQGEVYYFDIDSPGQAVFIPPLNWLVARFSPNSVLLGMSDRAFSEDDYIRDLDNFGKLQERNK
ncbi:sugar 3,4-ketoisomerase [Algoriphagus aquimarinus]|uniref:WxcM-like, C-terminal n=1 Tax=Algoriphagus aquimarinus TaxID=237018 RepID=A0A1I0XBS8_9BACT|nr:FdtA/QdtA family cupin domain-containing protein [Algoriphagus aquimarinus]SFA98431.1 WxcM-like, C-terminal [Algoriphagus aquimarinus]|tara:strand:+ start:58368 stop:58793 length:426 start_codon:yes stop_codon:yes gene_type:complete